MSLSSALSNSLSGLNATARAAEVVSSNVANAHTDGYGVRTLNTSANATTGAGGGVIVDGIGRRVDELSQAGRRSTDAEIGSSLARGAFFNSLQFVMGMPEDPGSLSSLVGQLETDLLSAASRPDLDLRLGSAVASMVAVTDKLNTLSDHVQSQRESAEAAISDALSRLNTSLKNIEDLNAKIRTVGALGHDTSALKDTRDRQIDSISDLVPVRVMEQDFDQIALGTETGTFLVNSPAVQFTFDAVSTITPDMSLASGALAPLAMDGRPLDMDAPFNPVAGGRLEALFDVRDRIAPEAQRKLDVMARDLIERTTGASVDPTWVAGSPGGFTDAGASFNSTNLEGLSARISVNAGLVPSQGGSVFRLRDGLLSVAPGDTGNPGILLALRNELAAERTAPLVTGQTHSGSAQTLVDALLSEVTSSNLAENEAEAFATAERFRDMGARVMLLMDSVTRFADAHREVALISGESPSMRGYPPSTAQMIMDLCERAGPGAEGSGDISAIFSVLVAGSDMEEPVADILRGVLDGHIVLDREIAERGRFPAIDVLRSVSRSLPGAATQGENELLADGRRVMATFDQARLMVQSGLYSQGADADLDRAVALNDAFERFLSRVETGGVEESFSQLKSILAEPEPASVPETNTHGEHVVEPNGMI